MTERGCAPCRELAAELAMGLVTGRERADALAHLQGCAQCREHLAALTRLHDELRALVPATEPTVGFETRVLDRFGPARTARLPRIIAAVVAAVAVFAGGWTLSTLLSGPATPAPPAAGSAERAVLFAPLTAGDREVGQVYAYAGTPSWLYLYLEDQPAEGPLTCAVLRRDETSATISFPLADGDSFWGGPMPVDRETLAGVRVTDATGAVLATAELGDTAHP